MREKLIALLDDALLSVDWDSHDYPDTDEATDILIANGVTIPVRCKDCKYGVDVTESEYYLCNRKMLGMVRHDDFCSYGERRTDD